MAIKLYNSSIKDVYAGDNKIKSVYVGDNLVYSAQSGIEIDPLYNYFVFDTNKVSSSKKVTLNNYRAGDSTTWDGLTDWGDGTIDSNTSHTYASDGVYTVKTKYMINNNTVGDSNTRKMLINCTSINKNITSMEMMFCNCSSLTTLDVSSFDTSNVTTMRGMFSGCKSLTSLDLSSFNTSNVTNTASMFSGCSSLTSLDLPKFKKLYYVTYMFSGCSSLVTLYAYLPYNISGENNLSYMFKNCSSLEQLDLYIDSNRYTIFEGLFDYCSSLTLDNLILTSCGYQTQDRIISAFNNRSL